MIFVLFVLGCRRGHCAISCGRVLRHRSRCCDFVVRKMLGLRSFASLRAVPWLRRLLTIGRRTLGVPFFFTNIMGALVYIPIGVCDRGTVVCVRVHFRGVCYPYIDARTPHALACCPDKCGRRSGGCGCHPRRGREVLFGAFSYVPAFHWLYCPELFRHMLLIVF